jgi:hypothetical protein
MTLRLPSLTVSIDPLVAEAKRRARRRRLLAAAVGLVIIAAVVGTTLALRRPGKTGPSTTSGGHLATTNFARATLTYPAAWKTVAWNCWLGVGQELLLTTARPTPTCGASLPPKEKLGRDGVAVWLASSFPSARPVSGTLLRNMTPASGVWSTEAAERVSCGAGAGSQRRFGAHVQQGKVAFALGAVVCGPDYRQGERALQRMISSTTFMR